MSLDDLMEYHQLMDGYTTLELVDTLLELGIISKEILIRDYWYEIEENMEEILPFPDTEEE